MLQGLSADVGGDGAGDAALLEQVYRQIAVIRANIRQAAARRHKRRQQRQAGL